MTSSRTNIDNEIIPSFRTTLGVMYVTLKKGQIIAALFTLAKAWKQCKQFPGSSGQNLTLLLPRTQVQCLVRELRFHKPCSAGQEKKQSKCSSVDEIIKICVCLGMGVCLQDGCVGGQDWPKCSFRFSGLCTHMYVCVYVCRIVLSGFSIRVCVSAHACVHVYVGLAKMFIQVFW